MVLGCFFGLSAIGVANSATSDAPSRKRVPPDIRSTKHNLSGSENTEGQMDEREICVFCHTPKIEIGGQKQTADVKLHWQRSLSRDHSFVIYDDIGRLGLGKESIGSQSIACMSCHDAVQAFQATGTQADHPFGVPYRGAIKHKSAVDWDKEATPYRAAEHLKALEDFQDASQGVVEDRTVWWVSRSGVTARRTRQDLPLYSRPTGGQGEDSVEVPFVECSSCHDPHSATTQVFLRIPNHGSQLCLTCHSK